MRQRSSTLPRSPFLKELEGKIKKPRPPVTKRKPKVALTGQPALKHTQEPVVSGRKDVNPTQLDPKKDPATCAKTPANLEATCSRGINSNSIHVHSKSILTVY